MRECGDYDFGGKFSQIYKEICICGEEIEVSTQDDKSSPEYHTAVHIRCRCGKSVEFSLPVN